MGLGDPIDEALDQLEPAAPVTKNPIDEALDRMTSRSNVGLRKAVVDAQPVSPEQSAEARRLSLKFGVPPSQALRERDALLKREAADLPFSSIESESPHTAEWLKGEGNAALAKDDLEQLGLLEWMVTAPQRGFQQSVSQMRASSLRTASLFRPLSREEEDALQSEKFNAQLGGALGAGESWFRKAVVGGSQLLANILMGFERGAQKGIERSAQGAAIGATAGALGFGAGAAPGALAGMTGGFTVGTIEGALHSGFEMEAGAAYDEFLDFKDEAGQPIDPSVAKVAALASGALNAGVEMFQLGRLAEAIPGVDKLKGVIGRDAIRNALKSPSIRAALAEAGKDYAKNLTTETATEVGQRAITILGGELAKAASGQNIPLRSAADVLEDLANEGAGALAGFSLLGVAGPGRQVARDVQRARAAQANVAWFTALGEGTAASKVGQRSPEALEQFLSQATDGGPVEAVYAPLEQWKTYWQGQGIDPAKIAREVTGDANAYAEAEQSGTDLKIPTAKYATKLAGTEHNGFFVNELRLAPEDMNAREAAAFLEEQKAIAEQLAAEAGQPTPRQQIRQQLEQQLVERGGFDQRTAGAYAGLVEAAVGTMAESAGEDPAAVYQRYGLTVERPAIGPEGTVAAPAATPSDEGGAGGGQGTPGASAAPEGAQPVGASAGSAVAQSGTEGTATGLEGLEDVAGLADLVAGLGGAQIDVAGEGATQENASGDSAASLEALSRQSGMSGRGEKFVVYNRSGQRRELIGPDAVDYQAKAGETYGVEGPTGFRQLENRGGRVPAGAAAGPVVSERADQLARAHEERSPEGAGDGGGAQPGRLPSPGEIDDLGTYPEGFTPADPDVDAGRLTDPVRAELTRIADELNEFPFTPRSWSWLETGPKTGNAGGGDANIVAGAAGAAVYDDVLDFSPLNKGKGGGLAKTVRGSRAQVEIAVRKILEGGRIGTNLAEGAVRVAERRAAGDYRHISRPALPMADAVVADEEFTNDLSAAIDAEVEAGALEQDAVDQGGDDSFDTSTFGQDLFDLFAAAPEQQADESTQEQSEREFKENADRVAQNPEAASRKDLLRAASYLSQVRQSMIRKANRGDRGPVTDAQLAAIDTEIAHYDRLAGEKVDVLDTGEQQPRLPEAGAVRNVDIATPEFEAPFSLTSETSKATKGKQTTLFQPTPAALPDGITVDVDAETGEHTLRLPNDAGYIALQAPRAGEFTLRPAEYLYVQDVVVEERRQGNGTKLYLAAIDYARSLGLKGLSSIATARNEQSEGLWRALAREGNVGKVGDFDVVTGGRRLNQPKRGAIVIGPNREIRIQLFERADLSTFLHESGHFFLELMGDLAATLETLDPETLSAQQRRLLADWGETMKFLGVENRRDIKEEHHEKWARAFESYLGEGKAPSEELRQSFAWFRAWLIGIYRSLTNLRVELSPEVRGVFDRMLASEQAIVDATAAGRLEPMFLTPEAAGMTKEEFDLYANTVAAASRTAREQLDAQLAAEVARERTAVYKARRAEVEQQVREQAQQAPVYRALAAIRKGENPDGTPVLDLAGNPIAPRKLSKEAIVERYGVGRLRALPRPYVYTSGGVDPDIVADEIGYSSGDELLQAIETSIPMEQAIALETERRMLAENGSIMLDGTLDERAQVAVANDVREAVIRAEIRALNKQKRAVAPFVAAERRAGAARAQQAAAATAEQQAAQQAQSEAQLAAERKERDYERRWLEAEARLRIAIAEGYKQTEIDALQKQVSELKRLARGGAATIAGAVPNASTVRAAAEARIARTRIRDLKPGLFWSAAREASTKATAAAARQEFDEAIRWKTAELVNLALYREAGSAMENVARRVKAAKDLSKQSVRQTLGLAGEAYTDQVDGILDRYEFAKVPAKVLARRASVRKFVEGLESEGLPVDLPAEVLEDARRINYTEVTVEELIGITDGLQQLVHLARFKTRLLRKAEQRTLDKLAADLKRSIEEHSKGKRRDAERDRRASEERKRTIAAFFASHRKLASLLRELDGFEDGGPMWDAIMRPLNEAAAREAEMTADAGSKLRALLDDAYPGRQRSRLYDKVHIAAIGKSLSKMERLSVALNWGNEGNRQRLKAGEGWNDQQVAAVLGTLDARDWAFVQGTFDYIDSFWPEIAAKQTRVYGIAPEKVEASPIKTAFGEFRGGYFPIKGDERLDPRASRGLDIDAANLAKSAAYANATTKRNHTKERAARDNKLLRRDFGVIFEHVGQVIHDLSHHEMLIDVGRILAHPDVSRAIYEHYGDETYHQIKATIRDVAFGEVPATQAFEKALNYVRAGATIAGMGWSLSTALLQPIGLTQSIVRVGPKWVALGVGKWIRNAATFEGSAEWIQSRSAVMRSRSRTQQQGINDIRNTIGASAGRVGGWVDEVLRKTTFNKATREGIADSYFYLLLKMQQVVDEATWLGAYEKAMATGTESEQRAIAIADQAVLDSQGGGQAKDLAQVQRGTPALKLWMNFYSFFNTTYNLAVESKRKTRHPAEVGRLAVDYLLLFTIPATLGYMIREGIFGGGDDDEDTGEAIVRENLAYTFGLMAGLREFSGLASGYAGYDGPAGARGFSAVGRFVKQAEQGEADEAFWKSLWDAGGILLHYPTAQTKRTFEGISALAEGRTSNPLVVLTGAPEE
jgi:GNAT superfamily N-acetyltransferase